MQSPARLNKLRDTRQKTAHPAVETKSEKAAGKTGHVTARAHGQSPLFLQMLQDLSAGLALLWCGVPMTSRVVRLGKQHIQKPREMCTHGLIRSRFVLGVFFFLFFVRVTRTEAFAEKVHARRCMRVSKSAMSKRTRARARNKEPRHFVWA